MRFNRRGDDGVGGYVNSRLTGLVFLVIAVTACSDAQPTLVSENLSLGQVYTRIVPRHELSTSGPRTELTVQLDRSYVANFDSAGLGEVRDSLGRPVTISGRVVVEDSVVVDLIPVGRNLSSDGPELLFGPSVTLSSAERIVRIELRAENPVGVKRVTWWSGDPSKRCLICT